MKTAIASLALTFIFGQQLYAQENTSASNTLNPNAPEMTFEKELYDFGTFKQGGNGTYDFKFTNSGREPLIISNARGSCGCTVPSWPKEPVKPNEGSVIKVTYDTQRVGAFTKTVTISSNAKTAEKVITIKGVVEAVPVEETFPGKRAVDGATPFAK